VDVLDLIDRLHHLVDSGRNVPLRDQARVNKRGIRDILDQMRATIPGETKEARWIVQGAEDYADEVLNTLELNLAELVAAIQRGRERLRGTDERAEIGGTVVMPPFEAGPVRIAVLADPQGGTFSVSRYQPEAQAT
jgi:hypothetical protein